jgi:hypothetical protein
LKLSPAQAAVKAPSGPRVSSISASPMQMTHGVCSVMREPYQEASNCRARLLSLFVRLIDPD